MSSESMVDQYLETALWSSMISEGTEDAPGKRDGEPFDAYFAVSDFTAEARSQAEAECAAFLALPGISDICARYDDGDIGHNLWLNRNGHGAGFWDGDFEDAEGDGDKLSAAAESLGEVDLTVTKDAEGTERVEFA